MSLSQQHCVPCEGGVEPLNTEEVSKLISQVSDWELSSTNTVISKQFKFPDFKSALSFVNKVGDIAESEGHHPDITLSWGKVEIALTTHAIKGLSTNDFVLASKIDALI
ncbi:4a-hydroxytetrahydrobiopterin dehydratase [bacterium]|nr:4a-hydroxytetrahydrobiopterin dehydratase [bacterium]